MMRAGDQQEQEQRRSRQRVPRVMVFSIGLAVTVIVVVALFVTHRPPTKRSADFARDWCASATEIAGAAWIPLASGTSDEVASKISGGELGMLKSRYGTLVLAPPVLVHPLDVQKGQDADVCPHWIASSLNPSTHRTVTFDYVYDYPHHRMRFSNASITHPGDAYFGQTFPYMSSSTAIRLLREQRGVGPMAGQEPLLMFFWLPTTEHCTGTCVGWKGGGDGPGNAIWLLIGSDGVAYFVGADSHVYTQSDLPIA